MKDSRGRKPRFCGIFVVLAVDNREGCGVTKWVEIKAFAGVRQVIAMRDIAMVRRSVAIGYQTPFERCSATD